MENITKLQKQLTLYLKHLKLDNAAILFIMLTLKNEDAQEALVLYLREHQKATQEELMQVAVDLQETSEEMKEELDKMKMMN